jgi:hypothetical protein
MLQFVLINYVLIFGSAQIDSYEKNITALEFCGENSVKSQNLENRLFYENATMGLQLHVLANDIVFYEGSITIFCETIHEEKFFLLWQLTPDNIEEAIKIEESDAFQVPAGQNTIDILFQFPLFSFSGYYRLSVFIFRFNSDSNSNDLLASAEFDVVLVLGPFFSLISILLFFVGLFLIIVQQESLTSLEFLSKRGSRVSFWKRNVFDPRMRNVREVSDSAALGYLKIQCPDCRKKIIEGSAFCPYCGYHLRKFERFL